MFAEAAHVYKQLALQQYRDIHNLKTRLKFTLLRSTFNKYRRLQLQYAFDCLKKKEPKHKAFRWLFI